MRKAIMCVLALGLIVGIAGSAMAAVENVKVGGDITIKGIYRSNFDLAKAGSDGQHYIYSGTRVFVCADLSNKVSTMIRFINERDFGNDYLREVGGSVILDLAYVKLSDLMTPGLNLTLGRQEIQIGEGMVVGSRYRALDYAGADLGTVAVDLGMQKAFDAVKLDYTLASSPISFSLFRSKIVESYNSTELSNTITIYNPNMFNIPGGVYGFDLRLKDIDLTGLEMNWKTDRFTVNPYFVDLATDGVMGVTLTTPGPVTNYDASANLMTVGVRGTWKPIDPLNLKAEVAKQLGTLNVNGTESDFDGWGGYIGGDWTFAGAMKPVVKLGYSHFTGQDTSADITSWVPVFPSNVASRIGKIAYATVFPAGEGIGVAGNGTGVGAINIGFGIQPTEKIGLSLDVFNLRFLESPVRKAIGNEIDLGLNYAYSEDVSMGLDIGYFITGSNIKDTVGVGNELSLIHI